ncbi:MAG: zinc metallopeptidase [Hyphomicrobiales bacterium]|jgi:Zn-dependent membrane protease YugP|nr:zinc metallopeptidase [Hyphomicrobiales bacterium]
MPILIGLGVLALLVLIFGPQVWVQWALKKHSAEREDLPGTGGELARHLLDEAGLDSVAIEETEAGDHYDPETRTVRLTPGFLKGKSIAAVAVATHEVSHAIQHAREEPGFMRRMAVVGRVIWIDRIGTMMLLSAPVLAFLVKAPVLLAVQIALGIVLLLVRVAVHLVTLPIEYDASFRKALPILKEGRYLSEQDLPAARHVLKAAAWTYVASALATLLDVMRWFRIVRI